MKTGHRYYVCHLRLNLLLKEICFTAAGKGTYNTSRSFKFH